MKVRGYTKADRGDVEQILERAWSHDPFMREACDLHGEARDKPWQRTLVVEEGGPIIAVGTVLLGRRHPGRYWLSLTVAPQWRGRGIGSLLLAELRSLVSADPRPFRARARPSDVDNMRFLQRHGFQPCMRSWEGTLAPWEPEVREPLASLATYPDRFRLTEPKREELRHALPTIAAFYEDWYHSIHRWDPPVRWSVEQALDHFCGPDLVAESVVCLYRGQELVGVGALILPPGGAEGELYLNQLGVLGMDQPISYGLTATLVSHVLAFAAARRVRVRFEVDDTHRALWSVLESLPLLSSDRDFMLLGD